MQELSRARSARMDSGYLSRLPVDIRRKIREMGLSGEWGSEEAWNRALQKAPLTEVQGWSTEALVLTPWRIDLKYERDPGRATSKFLKGLKQGRLLGTKCDSCSRTLLPPRIFCEWCFRDVNRWVELSGSGEVATYSISHVGTDPGERLQEPIIVCVIWLDGTKVLERPSKSVLHAAGLLHLLGGVKPEKVRIGMKVRPVWRPRSERKGSILDIKYFAPSR